MKNRILSHEVHYQGNIEEASVRLGPSRLNRLTPRDRVVKVLQCLPVLRCYTFWVLKPSQIISFLSLVKNCNHKGLGIYYLLSAFIFGISGTLISVLIRIELYSSGNRIISPENQNFYNISITLHGFLMIFFLVMPGLFGGFGNYFVPIFQGSPEVVYPRINNFSILILSLSYLL